MAVNVGTIFASLILDDQLTPALTTAANNIGQVGDRMQRAGSAFLPISAAIAAAGAAAFKFGKDFEATMTRVGVITDIGAENIARVSEEVLRLAGETARAPQELADALLVVASTGMDASESIQILELAAQAAAVGLGETKDVARAVTSAMTAYSAEGLTAAEATNKLFVAVRAGGAEADEFAGSLGRVVGIAAEFGISFDELLASVATFTRLGVSADEAVTALRGTISALFGTQSEQATEAFKELGTSITEVRNSIQEDGLAVALTDLVQLADGNTEAISAIIPEMRALAGVLGTAASQAEPYAKNLKDITGATTELDAAFKVTSQTVEHQWNQALSDAQAAAIGLFDVFKDEAKEALVGFSGLAQGAREFVTELKTWPEASQNALFGLGALLAVAGPGLLGLGAGLRAASFAFGGLALAVSGANSMFIAIRESTLVFNARFALLEGGLAGLGRNMLVVFGPAGIFAAAVLGVMALAEAFDWLAHRFRDAEELAAESKAFGQGFQMSLPDFSNINRIGMPALGDAANIDLSPIGTIAGATAEEIKKLNDEFEEMGRTGRTAAAEVSDAMKELLKQFSFAEIRAEGERYASVLQQIGGVTKLTADEADQFRGIFEQVIEKFNRAGPAGAAVVARFTEMAASLDSVGLSMARVNQLMGGDAQREALQMANALASGQLNLAEMTDEAQQQIAESLAEGAEAWRAQGRAVPEVVRQQQQALAMGIRDTEAFKTAIQANFREAMDGIAARWAAQVEAAGERARTGMMTNLNAMVDLNEEAFVLIERAEGTTLSRRIAAVQRDFMRRREALDEHSSFFIEAVGELARVEKLTIDEMTREWEFGQAQTRDELTATAIHLEQQYRNMERSGEFTSDQLKEKAREVKEAWERAAGDITISWEDVWTTLRKGADYVSAGFGIIAEASGAAWAGIAAQAADVAGDLVDIWANPNTGAFEKILQSAIRVGQQIADALFRTAGEDVVRRAAHDWGVTIGEELGDTIAATAKERFNGDRLAGELFHMSDLIDADEGLSDDNLSQFLDRLRDVFVKLETNVFSTADAVGILDENFAAFAEAATQGGRLVSAQFQEIIALTREFGLEVEAVNAFVQEQIGGAVAGLDALMAGVAVTTETQAVGMASAITAAFAGLVEHGLSAREAIEQLAGTIDTLQAQLHEAGIGGGAAFDSLAAMSALAADEVAGPLIDAIHGASEALTGLHNANLLSQESFSGIAAMATAAFDELVASGADVQTALQLMGADLQTIWELQTDFGYAVDAGTQSMLDQAEAAGVVGEAHRSAQEQMAEAMGRTATAVENVAAILSSVFGEQLPAHLQNLASATESAAGRANTAIAGIGTTGEEVFGSQLPASVQEFTGIFGEAAEALQARMDETTGAMSEDWNAMNESNVADSESFHAAVESMQDGTMAQLFGNTDQMRAAWHTMNEDSEGSSEQFHETVIDLQENTLSEFLIATDDMTAIWQLMNQENQMESEETKRQFLMHLLEMEDGTELWKLMASDDFREFAMNALAAIGEIPTSMEFMINGRWNIPDMPSIPGGGGGGGNPGDGGNSGGTYQPPPDSGYDTPPSVWEPPENIYDYGAVETEFAYALGGMVPGSGPVVATVHGGEGILTPQATSNLGGAEAIDALNAGLRMTGETDAAATRSDPTLIVNVTLNGTSDNPQETRRQAALGALEGIAQGGVPMDMFITMVRQVPGVTR